MRIRVFKRPQWQLAMIGVILAVVGIEIDASATADTFPASSAAPAACSPTFVDDPLRPGETLLRAQHIIDLRSAIDCLRVSVGLGTFPWNDQTITTSTPIRAVHVTDLRTALDQVYQQAGKTPPIYTDSDLAGQFIYSVHLDELRRYVKSFNSDPIMEIESPVQSASVAQPFSVSGWAIDLAAIAGIGVDVVRVRAIRSGTTIEVAWGTATLGTSRPDIGAIYGSQFVNSGYSLTVANQAAGEYAVFIDAHSVSSGLWNTKATTLFVDLPVNLTIGRQGTGTGGVSAASLSCPGGGSTQGVPCGASYAPNTPVSLTAQPDSGSTFTGWSGACTGMSTCAVTMTAALYVQADFSGPLVTQTKQYYHLDALGSVRVITDQSGGVLARRDYQPFGEDASLLTGDPRRFTGKERDPETGLDYFEARYYRASPGRFTVVDAVGGHLEDPQSLNAYAYARNNPLRYTDSSGLDFYLSCAQGSGNCQGVNGSNGALVQGTTDVNGMFNPTVITSASLASPASGNTAVVNAGGVLITTGAGTSASRTSQGIFINGTPAADIAGDPKAAGWSSFSFHITSSDLSHGVLAEGSAVYHGKEADLASVLKRMGAFAYVEDFVNPYHPGATNLRFSKGAHPEFFNYGPSPHFIVTPRVPTLGFHVDSKTGPFHMACAALGMGCF